MKDEVTCTYPAIDLNSNIEIHKFVINVYIPPPSKKI